MRQLIVLVLLGGCAGVGATGGGGTRPGVMPMLSELPGDSTKRDAVLESAGTTATPEHRQGMTSKEQKAETAAATAAAILGELFSKTKSVTIGTSSQLGEAPHAVPHPPSSPEQAGGSASPGAPPQDDDPGTSNADLIPWIKVK